MKRGTNIHEGRPHQSVVSFIHSSNCGAAKAADAGSLPFKTMRALSYEVGLVLFIQRESCHSLWNDTRNPREAD